MPLARDITEDEIRTFEEAGVVHLKGLFDADWIERMRVALDNCLTNPGKLYNNLSHDDPNGKFSSETFRDITHFSQGILGGLSFRMSMQRSFANPARVFRVRCEDAV